MAKYNEKELADTSKFLSFVLRHKPEAIGIVLDREGWADIDKLILCAQKAGKRLTRALLDTVVATRPSVFPVTVIQSVCSRFFLFSSFITALTPPASLRSSM